MTGEPAEIDDATCADLYVRLTSDDVDMRAEAEQECYEGNFSMVARLWDGSIALFVSVTDSMGSVSPQEVVRFNAEGIMEKLHA